MGLSINDILNELEKYPENHIVKIQCFEKIHPVGNLIVYPGDYTSVAFDLTTEKTSQELLFQLKNITFLGSKNHGSISVNKSKTVWATFPDIISNLFIEKIIFIDNNINLITKKR